MAQASTAVYDNSKAFEAHLAKQGLAAALKRAKLRRRMEHKIVPHVRLLHPFISLRITLLRVWLTFGSS